MLQSFIKQLLARCHCLSLYFHRSTQVCVKTLWSGNSIFYIKCPHIYTHSTQFCARNSTTWCTYLSQAIYFHTETNSGNKIQVQNIYISFFNISKLDLGRQKTCMCSSSLNACANGYTLKCWLFFKIIQLLMLLSFGSCRNNCIMQCAGYHLAYMCSCFYSALPLLNQVISVSQPPSNPYSLHPSFFFYCSLREQRTPCNITPASPKGTNAWENIWGELRSLTFPVFTLSLPSLLLERCFWNVSAGRPQHLRKYCQVSSHPDRLTHASALHACLTFISKIRTLSYVLYDNLSRF